MENRNFRGDDARAEAGVLGIDNVHLDLPIAGVGSRTLAMVLDMILLSALLALWWMTGLALLANLDLSLGWGAAVMMLGSFLLQWGYFAALEITMEGRTPGKSALGLRVVSRDGGRPSVGAFLVRSFLRNLDFLLGMPLMVLDRRSRRLGDLVAGTFVVHMQDADSLRDEVRLGRTPIAWGAREIATVESFLRRAPRMEPARASALALRLLRWIDREDPAFVAAAEPQGFEELPPGIDRLLILRRVLAAETVRG